MLLAFTKRCFGLIPPTGRRCEAIRPSMQWPEGDFPVGNCPDDRGVEENPGDARGGGFLMMSVSDEGEWDVSSPKTVLFLEERL